MAPSAFAAARWPCSFLCCLASSTTVLPSPGSQTRQKKKRDTEQNRKPFFPRLRNPERSAPFRSRVTFHSPGMPSPPVSSSSVADGWAYEPPVRPDPRTEASPAAASPPGQGQLSKVVCTDSSNPRHPSRTRHAWTTTCSAFQAQS
jgi:hypothetical protein